MLAALMLMPNIAGATGVFVGNDPASVGQFELWLGCNVDHVLVFTDPESWHGIAAASWFVDRFKATDRPILWSVAMIPKGARLEDALSGKFDDRYIAAAQSLAQASPFADRHIYIRLGWEFNGGWFPWSASQHEAAFIAVYRHVATLFRRISPAFRFEWTMNFGQTLDPMTAYPGDDIVDVIGMDTYWMPQYLGDDPDVAFEHISNDKYGLRYLRDLGIARHKPIAVPEWGVQGNSAAPFISKLARWFAENKVLYDNYWNSDAAYTGMLSTERWPRSAAAFRTAFCPAHTSH